MLRVKLVLYLLKVDKGWRTVEILSVEFLSRVALPVPATCACIERLPT